MRDLLSNVDEIVQKPEPRWLVTRLVPDPHHYHFPFQPLRFVEVPVGTFRAPNRDKAIERAAFAIQKLAILKAYRAV